MEGIRTRSFTGSFLHHPDDLTHGKLQALQVSINGNPVVFVPVDDGAPDMATRGRRINCCSTRLARPGRSNGLRFMTPR